MPFYLYKAATLRELLYKAVQKVNEGPKEFDFTESEDTVSKLERLAKLHESGAISDEEYQEAKQKILK
ncbi:MAG: SHOCT domain-containing protein [Bacilli bacterium]|nr:SHOCT domain-containing protein [Bacilli bacterium]